MTTEEGLIALLIIVIAWLTVLLLYREFTVADRKIDAILDRVTYDRQRELLASMWLYTNWRYVTKNLTTEQKELWADVIDEVHRAQEIEDGTPEDFWPVERWWRE